jgi:hypothetical protein
MTDAAHREGAALFKSAEHGFYFWSAAACLAIGGLGFVPTYWAPMATGAAAPHPAVHVHAAALYCWLALHTYQAWLAGRGALAKHRALGLAGISLATVVTVTFLLVGLESGLRATAAGFGAEMRAFLIVTLAGAVTFAVLVALAIANVRRPEVHKRLMLAASVSLLGAPIARWLMVFLAPQQTAEVGFAVPPPVVFSVPPALIGDLILVAAIVFDWRVRGRVHPALAWATAGVVAVHVLSVPISETATWDAIARAFLALA